MKKITIIGGAGFLGTNLCRSLAFNGQDFEIIDLKISNQFPEKCKIGDVRDLNSLRETVTGDVVVYLAAIHRDDVRDKTEYERTNVDGARNVIAACIQKGVKKIVFTSSVAVYGFAKPGTDELGPVKPFNEYGRTKFDAEELLREWHSNSDNSLIIVRPTVIFGEGNRGNVYNLMNQIASSRFVMIGDGKNKKSLAYVGNVVSFLETCIATEQKYGLFNYVDKPDMTMDQLVGLIRNKVKAKDGVGPRIPYWIGLSLGYIADVFARLSGQRLPLSSIRVRKFVSSTEFRSAKPKLDNFCAPFSLEAAIELTLESEFIHPNSSKEIFYTE
jgi:nucleoside-diphosphate-sugar epimerase